MRIKIKQIIECEIFQCEMCGELLKQDGDGQFLQKRGDGDYTYTLHTSCLIDFLNKTLTPHIII